MYNKKHLALLLAGIITYSTAVLPNPNEKIVPEGNKAAETTKYQKSMSEKVNFITLAAQVLRDSEEYNKDTWAEIFKNGAAYRQMLTNEAADDNELLAKLIELFKSTSTLAKSENSGIKGTLQVLFEEEREQAAEKEAIENPEDASNANIVITLKKEKGCDQEKWQKIYDLANQFSKTLTQEDTEAALAELDKTAKNMYETIQEEDKCNVELNIFAS